MAKAFLSLGDFGDCIYLCPCMKLVAEEDGEPVVLYGMNGLRDHDPFIPRLPIIAPLLEAQDYIAAVLPFEEQVINYDASHFRRAGHPFGVTLCSLQASWLHLTPDCASPWLKVSKRTPLEIVVARSARYRNHHFPWRELVDRFGKNMHFVGLDHEYVEFCGEFGHVERLVTEDLLDVAEAIAGSELFIGNQSSPFAIAEGLKHNVILEVSLDSPDCIYRRGNAVHCHDGGLNVEILGHKFSSPPFKMMSRAHLGETPPGGWRVRVGGHTAQSYALEAVLQEIKMKLRSNGRPIPPDLNELVIEQSSVDLPPPPPMGPIIQI